MYTLIIANKNYSSWSLRPWIALRAAGVAFTEQKLGFFTEAFTRQVGALRGITQLAYSLLLPLAPAS